MFKSFVPMLASRVSSTVVGSTFRAIALKVSSIGSKILITSFKLFSPIQNFFLYLMKVGISFTDLLLIPFTIMAPYFAPLQPIVQPLLVMLSYLRVLLTPLVWFFAMMSFASNINAILKNLYLIGTVFFSKGTMEERCTLCREVIDDILAREDIDIEGMDCEGSCPFGLSRCIAVCGVVKDFLMETHEYPCEYMKVCPSHDTTLASSMVDQKNATTTTSSAVCTLSKQRYFPLIGPVVTSCEPDDQCMKVFEPSVNNNSQIIVETCSPIPPTAALKSQKKKKTKKMKLSQQLSQVVMFKRYCGDLSDEQLKNGELCIDKPTGTAFYLYLLECLALFVAFLLSIYAIESDESTDDTQWLTFWMVLILVSRIEGFTEVMLSKYPYYYLMRLVVILVLMCQGAIFTYSSIRAIYSNVIRFFSRKEKEVLL